MIRHRFAIAADIERYYGEMPRQTLQAIVIEMDGEPVAIVGLARERDRFVAFSEYKPELEPYLKTMPVLRAVKAAQKLIFSAPLPVVVCNTTNPKLLERLGFIPVQPGVHLCPN